MNVAVLGASDKPERYGYRAVKMLVAKGHKPFPVHPAIDAIEGIRVYKNLVSIPEPVDTVSVYLSAENSDKVAIQIINSGAKRVIFNPGSENQSLAARLREKKIEVLEACTLVLLSTGQF